MYMHATFQAWNEAIILSFLTNLQFPPFFWIQVYKKILAPRTCITVNDPEYSKKS